MLKCCIQYIVSFLSNTKSNLFPEKQAKVRISEERRSPSVNKWDLLKLYISFVFRVLKTFVLMLYPTQNQICKLKTMLNAVKVVFVL